MILQYFLHVLYGMIIGHVLISILHEHFWGQRFINFIEFPVVVFEFIIEAILEIILFPFIFLWKLFRHCIRPVELERIQNLKLMDDSTHLFGSIYFCHDKTAKRIVNRIFFYRVIRG